MDNKSYQLLNHIFNEKKEKEPIRRGCTNGICFCTGKCQEIIGWRDKPKEDRIKELINPSKKEQW